MVLYLCLVRTWLDFDLGGREFSSIFTAFSCKTHLVHISTCIFAKDPVWSVLLKKMGGVKLLQVTKNSRIHDSLLF